MLESASGAGPRVALLARAGKASDNLADALRQAGAALVLTADPTTLDENELLLADVRAVLVALEPGVEQALDRFDSLLMDPAITVIFDEADIAAHRAGWDAARWVRHLSAKLNRHDDVLPPGAEADQNWHPSPGQLPKPASAFAHLDLAPFAQEALARADSVPVDGIQIETATRIVVGAANENARFEASPFEAPPFEASPFDTAPLETAPLEAARLETAPSEVASLDDVRREAPRLDMPIVDGPAANLQLVEADDATGALPAAAQASPPDIAAPNLTLVEADAVPAVSMSADAREKSTLTTRFDDAISGLALVDIDLDPSADAGNAVVAPELASDSRPHASLEHASLEHASLEHASIEAASHEPHLSARQSSPNDVTDDDPFAGLSLEAMTPGPASAGSRVIERASSDDAQFGAISLESEIFDGGILDGIALESMSLESMPLESMPLESMPSESLPHVAAVIVDDPQAVQADDIELSAFDLSEFELEFAADPVASEPGVGTAPAEARLRDVSTEASGFSDAPSQHAGAAFILSDAAAEPDFVSYSVIDVSALQIDERAPAARPESSPLQFDDDAFFLQELSAGKAEHVVEFSLPSASGEDSAGHASNVYASNVSEFPAMLEARFEDALIPREAASDAIPEALYADAAATGRPVGGRVDGDALGASLAGPASLAAPAAHGFSRDLNDLEQRIAGLSLVDLDESPTPASRTAPTAVGVEAIVLVEAGLGGPDPVRQLLAAMPGTFSAQILVRLHLQGGRYDRLVAQMARAAAMPVALAESGEGAVPGTVYFLPEGMNVVANEAGLIFVADAAASDAVYAALPVAQSAIVFLSGSDPALVEAAMAAAAGGALVIAQSPDDCYDGAACAELRARGVASGLPAELAGRLSTRWPSRS